MIRQAIQKIMCCCGNGVGTSLIMQMTIEEALEYLGMDDIEVSFGSLADISADRADLFILSQELLESLGDLPAVGLEDLMYSEMAAELLKLSLGIE